MLSALLFFCVVCSEGSDLSDESDDEAELMRELERIKRERAEEQHRRDMEAAAAADRAKTESVVHGNPLMDVTGAAASMAVKRRCETIF